MKHWHGLGERRPQDSKEFLAQSIELWNSGRCRGVNPALFVQAHVLADMRGPIGTLRFFKLFWQVFHDALPDDLKYLGEPNDKL